MRPRAPSLLAVVLVHGILAWSSPGSAQESVVSAESAPTGSQDASGSESAPSGSAAPTASSTERAAEPATAEPATAEPATAEPATAEPATAEPATAEPATAEPEPASARAAAPSDVSIRVAVVLVGDPNDAARAAAASIEDAVRGTFTIPSDAALRASLVGAAGDDLIAPVVRDRRALGASERDDLPLLGALGDRADVALLLVVRSRAGRRELVGFDVRHRGFFEGAVDLDPRPEPGRVVRFVRSRGRAALSASAGPERSATPPARTAAGNLGLRDAAREPREEPEWIEANWPFLLAGALLAGAAAFVVVYTTSDSTPAPMLRFRPGGAP
jgi:hypothetical protein